MRGFEWKPGKKKGEKAADPTTFSPLPPERIEPAGIARDETGAIVASDGEGLWFEAADHQKTQQAVSRMLKGILPVADIVRKEHGERSYFLSRGMPIADIEHRTSKAEAGADLVVLAAIFGDADHKITPGRFPGSFLIKNGERKNGRVYYYDFEWAYRLFWQRDRDLIHYVDEASRKSLPFLRDKLRKLEAQFAGDEGERFIAAIVKASGMPVFDPSDTTGHGRTGLFAPPRNASDIGDPVRHLVDELRTRIEKALERTEERIVKRF